MGATPKGAEPVRKRSPSRGVSHTVAVERCGSYDTEEVHRAVMAALRSIGFTLPRGASVLLKPNIMAQNSPDQAATTHPAVVEALCRIFAGTGCRVTIGDSSAFYQGGCTRLGFVTAGMESVARKYGARLLPFEATRLRRIETGQILKDFYVTGAVAEHDLVVNLPKLKVHRLARYSGAIKNMYGCVPGGTKQVYHRIYMDRPDYKEFWGKPLVDVYESVVPRLTVMDAVMGLDKDGPAANGEPRFTGVLLASENGPALDVAVCSIIGYDPLWVPAVAEAIRRGLVDPERIRVLGPLPRVPYVKLPDQKPKQGLARRLDRYLFDQFIVKPLPLQGACRKCGECISGCAVNAITADDDGYPVINYERCIYCYCCSEYCSNGAIYLQGSPVNLLIRGIRSLLKL